MIFRPKHFELRELIDKSTYDKFGEKAWMMLDPYALISLENVRVHFEKPVYVNNWAYGGDLNYRGFRPRFVDVGADYSFHRLGKAFDFDVKGLSADEVRQEIINKKNEAQFKFITCLEDNISWVHMDLRHIPDESRILIVYP